LLFRERGDSVKERGGTRKKKGKRKKGAEGRREIRNPLKRKCQERKRKVNTGKKDAGKTMDDRCEKKITVRQKPVRSGNGQGWGRRFGEGPLGHEAKMRKIALRFSTSRKRTQGAERNPITLGLGKSLHAMWLGKVKEKKKVDRN